MADPPVSEQDLWGLRPNAPPLPAPANGQGPPPAPVQTQQPPPVTFSEGQLWGTEAMPAVPGGGAGVMGRHDGPRPPTPHAFDTGPPPVKPGVPLTQQDADDAREADINLQDEVRAFEKNKLSVIDYSRLPDAYTKEQHPDWGRLQTSAELLAQIQNPKELQKYQAWHRRLETRINSDVKAKNSQMSKARAEQLARDDAPYQSLEAREKTAQVATKYVADEVGRVVADVGSKDAATQREADFTVAVSPITTMSKPLPGTDPKAKPDATNRDFTPLRDAVTDIATHNRGISGEVAARAAIQIGTPGGGTDDKGKQVPGYNGRTGAGATNYKVIGRDELNNVMVQTRDGVRLRIPPQTYRSLMVARQQGLQRARQWEAEYKASQEPGMVRRAINWGLSKIPAQGF